MYKEDDCNANINKNSTYIQNSGYPTATTSGSTTCRWTFDRICDDLCQIRLDFDNLVIAQPDTAGACATDTLKATSPTGASPPVVCGTLTGQHSKF